MRSKLRDLLKKLEEEIKKQEKVATRSKEDANLLSQGAANSPSSSGDREHANNQAAINAKKLSDFKAFKTQIEKSLKGEAPKKIGAVCLVGMQYEDGDKDKFYLVDNPVYLPGFQFVSASSPKGKAIMKKSVGEVFDFKTEEGRIKGKVISIE